MGVNTYIVFLYFLGPIHNHQHQLNFAFVKYTIKVSYRILDLPECSELKKKLLKKERLRNLKIVGYD